MALCQQGKFLGKVIMGISPQKRKLSFVLCQYSSIVIAWFKFEIELACIEIQLYSQVFCNPSVRFELTGMQSLIV